MSKFLRALKTWRLKQRSAGLAPLGRTPGGSSPGADPEMDSAAEKHPKGRSLWKRGGKGSGDKALVGQWALTQPLFSPDPRVWLGGIGG